MWTIRAFFSLASISATALVTVLVACAGPDFTAAAPSDDAAADSGDDGGSADDGAPDVYDEPIWLYRKHDDADAGETDGPSDNGEGGLTDAAAQDVADAGSAQAVVDAQDAPVCSNACTLGATTCAANGIQTCALLPTGCSAWSAARSCPLNQSCFGAPGAAGCTFACGTGGQPVAESGNGSSRTLLSGLQYPQGLWIRGGIAYYTEAAGRLAGSGAVRLSAYDLSSGTNELLVNNPMNAGVVVVASDGTIYLAAYGHFGDSGSISAVDSVTHVETMLVNVSIAIDDMYIDASDNIYVIGPSTTQNATSVLFLAAGDYAHPVVLERGLGASAVGLTQSGCALFASIANGGIERINHDGSIITNWMAVFGTFSLSASGTYLYYANAVAQKVGRTDLATGRNDQTLLSGQVNPANVRYDPTSGALYVIQNGASNNDGTLSVLYPPP